MGIEDRPSRSSAIDLDETLTRTGSPEAPTSTIDITSDLDLVVDVESRPRMQGAVPWTIDRERAALDAAARLADAPDLAKSVAPEPHVLALPNPADFGPISDETELVRPRSVPPPLPVTKPSTPPPLPTSDRSGKNGPSKRPPPLPGTSSPPPAPSVHASGEPTIDRATRLVGLLTARAATLAKSNDGVVKGRTFVELAVAHETLGDDDKVTDLATRALDADPASLAARAIVRRRLSRNDAAAREQILSHLKSELAGARDASTSADYLAERARLLDRDGKSDEARDTYRLALGQAPTHAASLRGLERTLVARARANDDSADAWEELAEHLGRESEVHEGAPALSAWLHVERARILDLKLGRIDAAKNAYERALRLDPTIGPVRDAYVFHAAMHHDASRLANLLAEEASIEGDRARGARLELDAACIAANLLDDDARAILLLELAAARAPTTASVDRRVADELVRAYERASRWSDAIGARRKRLDFFTEPRTRIYELRRIAGLEERLGRLDEAARALESALVLDGSSDEIEGELDRVLALAGHDRRRVLFWKARAHQANAPDERARKLVKAATLAEALASPDEARALLRSAWAVAPGKADVIDALSRLLTSTTPGITQDAHALVDLYAEAARTTEGGRRVAYLERAALLAEELLGDHERAARGYEEVLRLAPGHRSAVLGLQRTAARTGDVSAMALALLEEAKLSGDSTEGLTLRVRAAEALATSEPERALAIVREVLAHDPAFAPGRQLEARLHANAGRWAEVAGSVRARIDVARTPGEKAEAWIELAHLQDVRLHAPREAVLSLREARKLDPGHPIPPEEISRLLEAAGDLRELRSAVEQLADGATTPQERARHLARAAELDEFALDDDIGAASLYERALRETPDDTFLAERHLRVLARRAVTTAGGKGTRVSATRSWADLLDRMNAYASLAGPRATALQFLSASLRVATIATTDPPGHLDTVLPALDAALMASPRHVGAMRALAEAAACAGSEDRLHAVLSLQGDRLGDDVACSGALWALATLEASSTPPRESASTYERILARTPKDVAALEAVLRLALPTARTGHAATRNLVVTSLRTLADLTKDPGARIAANLRLALFLTEGPSGPSKEPRALREATERLHDTLVMDPLSVTAATNLAELASRLGDERSAALAATSLAELSIEGKLRSRYFVHAAHIVWTGTEAVFGARKVRGERAGSLLEAALKASPDSVVAVERLSRVRGETGQDERLVEVFRTAIDRATEKDAVILLGAGLARVCRQDASTTGIALAAMRRVREVAPSHVPSLFTLADLFVAQRAWREAVEVLETIVGLPTDLAARTTALFTLANIHEKVLAEPDLAEDALRRALALDGKNPEALRLLVRRLSLAQEEAPSDPGKLELARVLERLSEVTPDAYERSEQFIELADVRLALRDDDAAELALIEAAALSPLHPTAFARLTRLFRTAGAGGEVEPRAYAAALDKLITRGRALGSSDARWHAALGHVLATDLDRVRDGVMHLESALTLDPTLHASRFELAAAHLALHAHDLATDTVLSMLTPSAEPLFSVANPGAALELLERALNGERKQEEAIVVSELRAIAGTLDDGRRAWLKARRLPEREDRPGQIERSALVAGTVPPEGQGVLLDLASAVAGLETKLFRADLGEIGISSRDRLGRRSGHPTRALFDRLARTLDLGDVELVVSPNVPRVRVIAENEPWILVPQAFVDLPETSQLSSLARALTRIALGVPWLEELPPPHIEALLLGTARVAIAGFGEPLELASPKLVTHYQTLVARESTRKHKQAIERWAASVDRARTILPSIPAFVGSLARAELRGAYVLTGDLLATIDDLRRLDDDLSQATRVPDPRALRGVLDHPFAGDVARFALTKESTALRRQAGSTWSA